MNCSRLSLGILSRPLAGTSLILGLLATAAPAQQTTVSPAQYLTAEGNGLIALDSPWRFQQIHTDQRNNPRTVRSLALRSDGASRPAANLQISLEVAMAPGAFASASTTYASNFAGPGSIVFTQKPFNLPIWHRGGGQPGPFDLLIVLDAPYAHRAGQDLLWELRVQNSSGVLRHLADGAVDQVAYSSTRPYGQACGFEQINASYAATSEPRLAPAYFASGGPAATAALLLVGLSNPNMPVLCGAASSSGETGPTAETDTTPSYDAG